MNTIDQTTKTLLLVIALALWGLFAVEVLRPVPVQAQSPRSGLLDSLVLDQILSRVKAIDGATSGTALEMSSLRADVSSIDRRFLSLDLSLSKMTECVKSMNTSLKLGCL